MKKDIKEFIVVLILFVISLGIFYSIVYTVNNAGTDNTKTVKKVKIKEIKKEEEKEKEVVEPYVNTLPDHRNDYGNQNIMGMIEIPGVLGQTLITRANDNEFYLNNNLWNVWDGIGAPYFDFRNVDLDNGRQINIYGHNTQNMNIIDKLPLSKTISYLDPNVFNTYKDLYLYTDKAKIHYEIIGVKIIEKSNNYHMTLNFYDNQDFIDHTNTLLSGSTNRKDVNITNKDRILVLQTCNYNPQNTLVISIFKTV